MKKGLSPPPPPLPSIPDLFGVVGHLLLLVILLLCPNLYLPFFFYSSLLLFLPFFLPFIPTPTHPHLFSHFFSSAFFFFLCSFMYVIMQGLCPAPTWWAVCVHQFLWQCFYSASIFFLFRWKQNHCEPGAEGHVRDDRQDEVPGPLPHTSAGRRRGPKRKLQCSKTRSWTGRGRLGWGRGTLVELLVCWLLSVQHTICALFVVENASGLDGWEIHNQG